MEPIQHPLCNDVLRRPAGMTEDECRDLHIRREPDSVWSFWRPSDEELAAIIHGGAVALNVTGQTHPPLFIGATLPEEGSAKHLNQDEREVAYRAIISRHRVTVAILKSALAEWTKESPNSKARAALVDRWLDLMATNQGRESDPVKAAIVSQVDGGEG